MDKTFQTVLAVPNVWRGLLSIGSFDDLSAFLEQTQPGESKCSDGLTRADWVRPIRSDHREVFFIEDGYRVSLELFSGNENYCVLASLVLPRGERYAKTEADSQIQPVETLEIRGVGKFTWQQRVVEPPSKSVDELAAQN